VDALLGLAPLGRRQRGLLTRAQALDGGLTPDQLEWILRSRQLIRMGRGIYAFPGAPNTWEQRVLATILLAGDGVVASHETAAQLYGARTAPDAGQAIEVSASRGRRIRLVGVRAHQSLVLFDADQAVRGGIPCTSPARLVVDLSGRRSVEELGRLVDDLQRRRLVHLRQVAQCASRLRLAPGRSLATVRKVLELRWEGYGPGDSDLESRILRALHQAGVPLPRQQVRVAIGGRRCYLDLAYPEVMLAIEIDSWAFHRQRSAFDRDRAKGNELALLGWQVLRVTDAMTDEEIVALVRRALRVLCHPEVA
jgi:very-short-patch-repair endonuclease